MSEVVHKFVVKPLHLAEGMDFPVGAEPLSVDYQGTDINHVKLWVKIDPECTEMETRYFYYVGTGQELPLGKKIFLGSVKDSLCLMWHVYEARYD